MDRKRQRSRRGSRGLVSRRAVLGALVVTGGAAVAQGTGAFSNISADRLSNVGVSSDEEGLLGISTENPSGQDGDTVTLFTLSNQTNSPYSISIELRSTGSPNVDLHNITAPTMLSPGTPGAVEAQLSCSEPTANVPFELEIHASGDGIDVAATREVQVSCTVPDTGVCAPLSPPGCIDDEFPSSWPGTDCSVVMDTTGEITETIGGGLEIDGAVDLTTDDEVDLNVNGSIADYVSIDTSDQIDIRTGGGASVGGPIQLSTTDKVKADLGGTVGGGVCANDVGKLTAKVSGGGTVDGPMELRSSDAVTVDLSGNASVGPLSVEASDKVEIDATGGSEIDGDVNVNTSDEVELDLDGNERIRGDVTIDATDEVTIELSGSTVIEGDVTIMGGEKVTIELEGNSVIKGDVTIDATDEVTIELTGSSVIEGDVAITSGEEVTIDLTGNPTIEGDVTIDTEEDVDVSGCRNIGGSVTPEHACD